jgi:hypothetical protein
VLTADEQGMQVLRDASERSAGVRGYLISGCAVGELVEAIRVVHRGCRTAWSAGGARPAAERKRCHLAAPPKHARSPASARGGCDSEADRIVRQRTAPNPPQPVSADMVEHKIDQALDMTFPASDPPAWSFLQAAAQCEFEQRSILRRRERACRA